VVTLLVSATPFCLLTRYSRVPRWFSRRQPEGGQDQLLCWDSADSDPSSVVVKDWHVVDWSEMVWRQCQKSGFRAHLRCHPGHGARSEDGFWYVNAKPTSTAGPLLSTVCERDADAGGSEFVIRGDASRVGQHAVRLHILSSSGSWYVGVSQPPSEVPTLNLTTSEHEACLFTIVLGLGEGFMALEYQQPSVARPWIVEARVDGLRLSVKHDGFQLKAQHLFRLASPAMCGASDDASTRPRPTYVRATLCQRALEGICDNRLAHTFVHTLHAHSIALTPKHTSTC
jgi:hypothetical protein